MLSVDHRRWLLLLVLLAAGGRACAVDVETAANRASLTGGYATQHGQALRLAWHGDGDRLVQLSLERKQAFGETASLVIGSIAQDLTADDRAGFALARSDAATILAQTRVDAFYSRKLLASRTLVGTLAGYASRVADGHQDLGVVASAAWYLADRQVAEAGLRWGRSNPGSNKAWRGFAGYTWGAVGHDTVALRLEAGHEAYQSLGANAAVANFRSEEVAFGWRHWLRSDAGLVVDASVYRNPAYARRTLGLTGFLVF
jgi:YaiO family outer membrane protein